MIISRNRLFVLFISLFLSFSGYTQILNDSTVNLYGPKTTRYFLEEDIYNSIDTLYLMDTALNAAHRYTFPERYNYQYQDLGNKGSAIQPLFYDPPSSIGFRSGYNTYNLYYRDLMRIRFYDTKSPFSKFHYVQGGKGVSFLETELSRNVSPNWNLGVTFNRISAVPQIQFTSRPIDPEVDHYSYSAYTAYRTENKKYFVDAYFRRMSHKVRENGGVLFVNDFIKADSEGQLDLSAFFRNYSAHSKNLQNALGRDFRINYHIYHQYNFSSLFGVYHLFDYERQSIEYEDNSQAGYNTRFYGKYYLDNTATPKETTLFKIFRNDLGLKGEINEFKYRLFYRRRNFFVDNMRLPDVNWQVEDVAGAELAVRFSERSVLHLQGEVLGNSSFREQANDYKINFTFKNRFVNANFTRGLYTPSYIQQLYFGNHHSYDKSSVFSPTESSDLLLSTTLPLGFIKLTPQIKASRVDKYIYFVRRNGEVQPEQLQDPALLILSPGLDLHLNLAGFNLRNSFTYNWINDQGQGVFRVPQMMENFLLYYERSITKKAHVLQIGFDGHWKSGYKADMYMPSIQQFYIQSPNPAEPISEVAIKPYFLIDVFASMKINRTRVFVKVTNLTEGLGNEGGYLVRPYYYGFRRVFDMGVNWMFFD